VDAHQTRIVRQTPAPVDRVGGAAPGPGDGGVVLELSLQVGRDVPPGIAILKGGRLQWSLGS